MWSLLHDLLAALGLGTHLLYRLCVGLIKRDPETLDYFAYRSGARISKIPKLEGPVIWFHGVSVGEVLALDGIIGALRAGAPRAKIAVSTMTSDGLSAIARLKNPPDARLIYPMDLSLFAKRVVKRLNPRALVLVDGDFWFQMLRAARRAGATTMIINGRLSERSVDRYRRIPGYARRIFSAFDAASVQSYTMRERFTQVFVPPARIFVDGNIKLDSAVEPMTQELRDDFMRCVGANPRAVRIVIGSLHPAELGGVGGAIARILREFANVQALITPRHPEKFTHEILSRAFSGINSQWIDATADQTPVAPLIWINRIGMLRDLYQIADIAFVGGTFCDVGGHNLAEPAQFGVAAIYGPDVHGQIPLHEILQEYGAARQVSNADALFAAFKELIRDPAARERMAANSARLRDDSRGLADRVAERIVDTAGLKR